MRTCSAAAAIALVVLTGCGQSTDGTTTTAATAPALIEAMTLTVDECTGTGAAGTVTNNHDAAVNLTIEVDFLDDTGEVLDTGSDWLTGVEPGAKADWEARTFTDKFTSCEADVTEANEA